MSELQSWATAHIKNPEATMDEDSYNCIFVHDEYGEIPFTASRHDTVGYGALAFMVIKDGLAGEISPLTPEHWIQVHENEIRFRLEESALSGILYDELTEEQRLELSSYRQTLRDLEYSGEGRFEDYPEAPAFVTEV